ICEKLLIQSRLADSNKGTFSPGAPVQSGHYAWVRCRPGAGSANCIEERGLSFVIPDGSANMILPPMADPMLSLTDYPLLSFPSSFHRGVCGVGTYSLLMKLCKTPSILFLYILPFSHYRSKGDSQHERKQIQLKIYNQYKYFKKINKNK
uniref:Uncharacterized protein n=1 Tax=Podarcis muralis TaxID=64176 RepID=A0A670IWM9_PODMU